MKSILVYTLFLMSGLYFGQINNIIDPEPAINTIHKKYTGNIIFLSKAISLDSLKEADFLTQEVFQEDKDLNLRIFLNNSLVNYLHQLEPSLAVDELLKKGNYQFNFYIDGTLIYTENLNPGAGMAEDKKKKTTFRIPLISSKNEDSWGRYLWMRFYLVNGGIDQLNEGNHLLKVEIKPYLKATTLNRVLFQLLKGDFLH